MTFSTKAIKYFINLKTPDISIKGPGLINPYKNPEVKDVVKKFYDKFYNDNKDRLFVIGINPGRFGGGLSGISFTDPVALRELCFIENNLGNRKELSSKFIYTVIARFGGADKFFSRVFLTALYPFAIVRDGKNYNYYDEKRLAENLRDDIVQNISSQIDFGARNDFAVLLGKKNAEYFSVINNKYKFFKKIVVLEHPRYIMQYKLKNIDHFIAKYLDALYR